MSLQDALLPREDARPPFPLAGASAHLGHNGLAALGEQAESRQPVALAQFLHRGWRQRPAWSWIELILESLRCVLDLVDTSCRVVCSAARWCRHPLSRSPN